VSIGVNSGMMSSVERSAAVDDLIAQTPGWRGPAIGRLRELIRAADPDIVEDVKWRKPSNPQGVAVWEHNGIVCAAILLKGRVRLSFFAGASLPDPAHLFNAQLAGKSRAIDFYESDALNERALEALVRAGVERNLSKAKSA
jgi:hypothetical protein